MLFGFFGWSVMECPICPHWTGCSPGEQRLRGYRPGGAAGAPQHGPLWHHLAEELLPRHGAAWYGPHRAQHLEVQRAAHVRRAPRECRTCRSLVVSAAPVWRGSVSRVVDGHNRDTAISRIHMHTFIRRADMWTSSLYLMQAAWPPLLAQPGFPQGWQISLEPQGRCSLPKTESALDLVHCCFFEDPKYTNKIIPVRRHVWRWTSEYERACFWCGFRDRAQRFPR